MRLGRILILVGILVLSASFVTGMIVTYLNVISSHPNGTLTSPTRLFIGKNIALSMALDTNVDETKTTCTVSGIGYSYSETTALSVETAIYGVYGYETASPHWTIPDAPAGTEFKFEFKYDGSVIHTSYGKIIEIDGYFSINRQQADTVTHIVVTDADLTFVFTATAGGEHITIVTVNVYDSSNSKVGSVSFDETVADEQWDGSFTLPKTGQYRLDGFFGTSDGASFQAMSIITLWGESSGFKVSLLMLLGLAAIISGIVVTVRERGGKK